MINSFSFVATKPYHREADILIWSIRRFYDQPIVIWCDSGTAEHLFVRNHKNVIIKISANPEDMDRQSVYHIDTHNGFHNRAAILKKMDVIDYSVKKYGNTMFLDCDIVLLKPIHQDITDRIMFSPHYNPGNKSHLPWNYGAFNAGYVFVSNTNFAEDWEKVYLLYSRYYEQEGMALLFGFYDIGKFSKSHNVGYWRSPNPDEPSLNMDIGDVSSIHCHFDRLSYERANNALNRYYKSWSEFWLDRVDSETKDYIQDAINLG